MVKRERLDTLEALMAAVEGYQHLPLDVLSQFLLDHYTVDLDVLAQFAETSDTSGSTAQNGSSFHEDARSNAQSAA
jgi:hypothetical protein